MSLEDSNNEEPENEGSEGKAPATQDPNPDQDKKKYPLRPAYGKKGSPVALRTNYLDVTIDRDLVIRKYSVTVIPPAGTNEPTGKLLERVIDLLLWQHFRALYGDISTDFRSTLLCRRALIEPDSKDFDVTYTFEDGREGAPEPRNPKIYQVRITAVKVIELAPFLDHLESSSAAVSFDGKNEIIQAVNIIFGTSPKGDPDILTIGANKHFWKGSTDFVNLGSGLLALRGYFVSVRPAAGRLLLNIQVKHIACYNGGPLDELMLQYGTQDIEGLDKFLKGVRFRPSHIEASTTKTICGVAKVGDGDGTDANTAIVPHDGAGPQDVQFYLTTEDGFGQYISVYDYFTDRKSINIVSLFFTIND